MGNRENKHPSLIDAYFNGVRSEMTIDTGAAASILHHTDDPKRDRIFKIKGRKSYYLPHRYDVNWREMDPNIAPTLNKETEYDEVYWSSDDESEDMRGTSSDDEDEDMGDTSSNNEGEDNVNKPTINKDESRLIQIMPPNNYKIK